MPPRRIVVFGATGRTGMEVVKAALSRGHAVTAFVRDPSRLGEFASQVRWVQGTVSDAARVEEAVRGNDAVICTLSAGDGALIAFTDAVLPAMARAGVRRLVSLVGAGVAQPGDPNSIGRTVMISLMRVVAPALLKEASAHAERLTKSGLEWTLVRPPRLNSSQATGRIVHTPRFAAGPSHQISRADVAAFMVEVVESDLYVRQSPVVYNAG